MTETPPLPPSAERPEAACYHYRKADPHAPHEWDAFWCPGIPDAKRSDDPAQAGEPR